MTLNLKAKIYNDEDAARRHLEKLQWPSGPVCPHCGVIDEATKLEGKSTRPGVYKCRAKGCEKPFSVTVGTVFERSHIPLSKWLLATELLTSSKKGISAHQLHRMLDVTYKTAWFMAHRIREAMTPKNPPQLGGEGQTVEADETYIGRRAGPHGKGIPSKIAVLALVERKGRLRSFAIGKTTKAKVHPLVRDNVALNTKLFTDEAPVYKQDMGFEHESVNHSRTEYVRYTDIGSIHTNTVEGVFSIFRRGMVGTYQHCGEAHLHRYLAEFDFRYSNRASLGVNDEMRADIATKGIAGKRLTYRRLNVPF